MSSHPERRKHARIRIDQMIELQFGQEQFIRSEGIDLSLTGILCTCADQVDPQTRIYLLFTVPVGEDTLEVQCDGIVVRSMKKKNHYDVAIRFTDISPSSREAIEKFLEHVG